MKNIKEFETIKEYGAFLKKIRKSLINTSTEGDIYLTQDKLILKDMSDSYDPIYLSKKPNIIMSDDLKLDSFIFPDELYVCDDLIVGYKSKYFKGDIFEDIYSDINVKSLIKAREKFIEDLKIITNEGYFLFELPCNVLFNNKKLCAIDTLDYIKKDNVELKENIELLDYGLIMRLQDHGLCDEDIDYDQDFDKAITKIKRR